MNDTRSKVELRSDRGAGIGIVGLVFAGLGWVVHAWWLIPVALIVALIGGALWLVGLSKSD